MTPGFGLNSPLQQQIKRAFKTKSTDNATKTYRDLHLEDRAPRKRSELQMYMVLFYDDRIHETVANRWAKVRVPSLECTVEVNVLESEIGHEDSFLLKDPRIPITFKNKIAQELWDAESNEIKAKVRSERKMWQPGSDQTVRTDDEDDRLALVREYQK